MNEKPLVIELVLLVFFFAGSFFFSGFESGVVAVDRHKLLHQLRQGDPIAAKIAAILRNTHRLLATVLVGNNICNIALSVLIAGIGYKIGAELGQTIMGVVGAFVTLIIGEYLPKRYFCANPLQRIRPCMGIFSVLQFLLTPFATVCIWLTKLISRRPESKSPFVSRESIDVITRNSQADGKISAFERLVIKQVLDLQMKRAREIMTPIKDAVVVYEGTSTEDCIRASQRCAYRLLPLFTKDGKTCKGLICVLELVQGKVSPEKYLSPIFIHPESPADEVLALMRKTHRRMIMVRENPECPVLGIIKQSDILHEILHDRLLKASTDRIITKPTSGTVAP